MREQVRIQGKPGKDRGQANVGQRSSYLKGGEEGSYIVTK